MLIQEHRIQILISFIFFLLLVLVCDMNPNRSVCGYNVCIFFAEVCFFSYQTTWLQFSPPPGLHSRSKQTPKVKKIRLSVNLPHYFHSAYRNREVFLLFTCSQVSRIMTSSVARSSWVNSPGTSSICVEGRMQG